MRIIDYFFHNAGKTPDKTAIVCDDNTISYYELERLVHKWSRFMVNNGVCRNDHIGVLLHNEIEFAALILVAANLGAALVPLSPALPENAIVNGFKASDVKHIIGKSLKNLKKEDLPMARGLWLDIGDSGENPLSIMESTGKKSASPIENMDVTGEENLILTLTSGSTGKPKPIVLTQKNKLDRALAAAGSYSVTENDVVLAATPLYHSLAERLVIMPMILGGTSVIMQRFTPALWLNCIKEWNISFTIAVSSQLAQIAEALTSPFIPDLTSLRCVVSSSALLEPHIKIELLNKLKCEFHECYGTSEVAIATSINMSDSKKKFKSVGVALPGVDVKIVKDDGSFAKIGEKGEIICKTPMLFKGYYKLPEMTGEAVKDGYFYTGDIGYLDDDGFLHYVDRKHDVIITGAVNVYPNDIESAILELSQVIECAAFPLPDDRLGEVVAVAIVPADKESFDQRQIKFHCAKRLADFQQPRKYFVLDVLPKNNLGKLMKRELVKLFSRGEDDGRK